MPASGCGMLIITGWRKPIGIRGWQGRQWHTAQTALLFYIDPILRG